MENKIKQYLCKHENTTVIGKPEFIGYNKDMVKLKVKCDGCGKTFEKYDNNLNGFYN